MIKESYYYYYYYYYRVVTQPRLVVDRTRAILIDALPLRHYATPIQLHVDRARIETFKSAPLRSRNRYAAGPAGCVESWKRYSGLGTCKLDRLRSAAFAD